MATKRNLITYKSLRNVGGRFFNTSVLLVWGGIRAIIIRIPIVLGTSLFIILPFFLAILSLVLALLIVIVPGAFSTYSNYIGDVSVSSSLRLEVSGFFVRLGGFAGVFAAIFGGAKALRNSVRTPRLGLNLVSQSGALNKFPHFHQLELDQQDTSGNDLRFHGSFFLDVMNNGQDSAEDLLIKISPASQFPKTGQITLTVGGGPYGKYWEDVPTHSGGYFRFQRSPGLDLHAGDTETLAAITIEYRANKRLSKTYGNTMKVNLTIKVLAKKADSYIRRVQVISRFS